MPSEWKTLASKGKKIGLKYGKEGLKYGKEGLKFAKQAAAESGLLGSYTIGGKEVVEIKRLASGGFASVKLVKDVNTNEEYALKKVKCLQGRSQVASTNEEAEREARLLSRINHPNIVNCIAWGRRESTSKKGVVEVIMMLELCSEGNLADHLHKNKGVLRPKEIVDCLFDTTEAIHFLHNWQRVPLCHRDIKIENIIRHKSGVWKICDFGSMCCRNTIFPKDLSKKGVMDLQDEIEKKVTMLYRPPEMVDLALSRDDREYDWPIGTMVDMWMLGCVTYCLLFGQHPFHESATVMAIRNAKYHLPRNHPNMCMKNLMLLAQWLMAPRPDDRPDTEKLLGLLANWQTVPDLFEQLPTDMQDRLQKTWNLYGVRFTSTDRSSEGVFRKSRFEFVPKNDDLMKKNKTNDGETPRKTDTATDTAMASAPMPNLMEFFDEPSPPPIVSMGGDDLLGFKSDDEPSPCPSQSFDPFTETSEPCNSFSADPFDAFQSAPLINDPFSRVSGVSSGSGFEPFVGSAPAASSSMSFGPIPTIPPPSASIPTLPPPSASIPTLSPPSASIPPASPHGFDPLSFNAAPNPSLASFDPFAAATPIGFDSAQGFAPPTSTPSIPTSFDPLSFTAGPAPCLPPENVEPPPPAEPDLWDLM